MVGRLRRLLWASLASACIVFSAAPAQAIPVAAVASILAVSATSFVAIAVTIVLNVGLSLLTSALFAPKQNQQAAQAQATTLQLGENPRAAIFGEAAVAGDLVDVFYYGGEYGTDWNVEIRAIADHRCAALVGFYVNDTFVAYGGDGTVSGYNGQLEVYWLPGAEDQVLPSIVTTYGPGWTADDNMAGVACFIVAYKADKPTAKNPTWSSGRPTFLPVIKGALLYDPRKDSTVAGGSGSHRWDDPTTREWDDNAIVCRYNWVRGIYACDRIDQPDQLLVGRGLSAVEAPPENVAAYANICDEVVDALDGATEKRYTVGALIKADDEYIDTEEAFAAACGGIIIQPYGSVEIEPGHAKAPTFWITDDDIVSGTSVKYADYRSESDDAWVNTVIPNYVEPALKWASHGAPIRRVYDDVIADGKSREDPLTLKFVTSGTQAQRCGEIARRLGRLVRTTTQTFGPRFASVEDGDWGVWTSARRTGGQPVLMRVEAYALDEKWQNTLQLRQVGAIGDTVSDVYDQPTLYADGAVATQQAAPTFAAPSASNWTLTGITDNSSGGSVPALLVTGAVPSTAANSVTGIPFDVRAYVSGAGDDDNWVAAGIELPDITSKKIIEAPGGSFEVSLRYTVAGYTTDRLILGPVTAGALAAGSAATATTATTAGHATTAGSATTATTATNAANADKLGGTYEASDITSITDRLHAAGVAGF